MSLLSVEAFITDKENLAKLINEIARGANLTDQLCSEVNEHIAIAKMHQKTSNASILATLNEDNDDDDDEVKPVSDLKPVSFNKHSPLCITLMKNAAKREINLFFSKYLKKGSTDVNVNQLDIQKDQTNPQKMNG